MLKEILFYTFVELNFDFFLGGEKKERKKKKKRNDDDVGDK